MFHTVEEYLTIWKQESGDTQRVLDALTDASLAQPIANDHRTLGRIAWHLTGTMKEMLEKCELHFAGPAEHAPVPSTAAGIATAYGESSAGMMEAMRAGWTDASLTQKHAMYGEEWTRETALTVLLLHQVHHRGQMTVLMRQAGLRVPSVYGPAMEEWEKWGMKAPAI
jgi:uncharacterized damage-inducible protein DinB